jgi:acyl carrier protein
MYLKDIEKSVKEAIAELLDSSDDALNLDASFLELGLNSVLAVELVEAMNQKLGIELGVEVMFDYRDVKELAHFIFQHYGKETV